MPFPRSLVSQAGEGRLFPTRRATPRSPWAVLAPALAGAEEDEVKLTAHLPGVDSAQPN